jgi:C-terminal processing protease CtpA/Prc
MMTRNLVLLMLLLFGCPGRVTAQDISRDDKATWIDAAVRHLRTDYIDADRGGPAAEKLMQAWTAGEFANISDGPAFAGAVSAFLQQETGDGHLNVEYVAREIPTGPAAEEDFSAREMERWYGAHLNFGIERVMRLDGNIGLLDMRVMAPVEMGGDTLTAAMNVLAHTDALVIDLRNNGGGSGDMSALVASYLFGPERKPLTGNFSGKTGKLTQNFTAPYVPGRRYGPDKPVYVLISGHTFSAAEGLAYDLQALGRATIVGETSGGGAHPFEYLPVHPHFVLWSVTERSVNPITGSNWQDTGVTPDIRAEKDKALEAALQHLSTRRD